MEGGLTLGYEKLIMDAELQDFIARRKAEIASRPQ
ncbi:MAG: trimethylamine methyltransferase family protein [Acidimicrobiia bacterium]|nr:trimethylamine methyltransferase family protein [Acidimicrobiia bacterium]